MPTLALTNFNIVCSVLGGFITTFGLVSYLMKEKFYLSEALISLLAGITFSPHAANFIRPLEYAGSQANINAVTLYFSRLVLGVQLVLAGVQLPSRYLKKEWRALALLLGPVMTIMVRIRGACFSLYQTVSLKSRNLLDQSVTVQLLTPSVAQWLAGSLLVWAMVPHLPFVHALAVAACVTPTDPVLSNSIVKGKFADKNIPKDLQKIIIAESGANDGLGYPFLFIALYLVKYAGNGGLGQEGGVGKALGLWFGETWGYTILLSVVYGATVGWVAKELLHWAEEKKFVDRESFLVFAITLALFIVGTCGIIGSDDVLACFIAGNVFTWDDWFRLETLDDSLQPTIDMLLNLSIFIWFGAICPWASFRTNDIIPIYRLIFLGVLVLLLRRLPVVFALHKLIHQIEEKRQAIFVGFFGPIGVSAIFYLYISLEFLETVTVADGAQREDAARLGETIHVVVWFLTICSIVVHGLSIPLGKVGFFLPRTLSRAFTSSPPSDNTASGFQVGNFSRSSSVRGVLRERRRRGREEQSSPTENDGSGSRSAAAAAASSTTRVLGKIGGRVIPTGIEAGAADVGERERERPSTPPSVAATRTIRYAVDGEHVPGAT
ncbi:Na(+)/H(+) antiporter 2 [Drepanopeziza brunnea f. sp. 'multigermtubi' MB_m1]|uniref:Na(+)/H(+) antiporter 2 n=1 Tax=Marssonina brunnea f. sp. multigermtubi (strain MB_m1) TaxID=1072389 RepID=K1XUB5_MARBU|nr:Na(+)/H(+) antiporter 2 [Drepanopeziza brunnea f. sp. 'multigermtubi' MB_m1]EKD16249.1 Na(+)/H(+) antiporter 2 [Drepanopeziza brunnea f. sp. 'multigermtubi' MB_m1]